MTVSTQLMVNPRARNDLLTQEQLRINDSCIGIVTKQLEVIIKGASCCACCDSWCDDDDNDKSTERYRRHTLSTVFNALREQNKLPDTAKLLNLWYINRDKATDIGQEYSDAWWYDYIKQHYRHVAFISCTLFDSEKSYSLYS